MEKKEWLTKILNIRREELKPVFLMMVFSFFIGLSLTFYFTASNAIFLKHFPPRMIPISFIASGLIVYIAWWLFSKIDKKASLSLQVTVKFIFVFLSVLAISIGVWMFDSKVLAFILYTWVRVMVYITLVNFWGLAGRLFNIRQGKRIFSLISVGEVVSIIIGYFSIPFILKVVKVSDVLFLASGSLFICVVVVILIFRTFKTQLPAGRPQPPKAVVASEWNYWNLLKKPYFRLISLMALLPIFGYLFVDYLFLAQLKKEFVNDPATIARFLGIFLGFLAVLELLFKLFSGRLLNKYGLKPSLLALPVILLFSIFLAAVFGTAYGTVGMFFSFIALARLFERSIRGSVYEPGFQLLYQPVPTEQRLPFQNQIEGIPKASGTVLTGVVILAFSSIPWFNLVWFNWLFIIVLGLWIWVAYRMYEEYRNMIKSKLSNLKKEGQQEVDPMDTVIRNAFERNGEEQYPKLIRFFEKSEPGGIRHALEGTKAFSYVRAHEPEERPFGYLTDLARSEEVWERIEAARLLGSSGRYNTYKLLISLLKDPDPDVRKAAIISSGRIRRVELWPWIIENLTVPDYAHAAGIAVQMIGEPILQDVDRYFEKIGHHPEAQLRILKIYGLIGGPEAVKKLRDKIYHPNHDIRFQVLLSLSDLDYHAAQSEILFIKQIIEDAVETMVWTMASLVDIGAGPASFNLQQALLQELEEKKEQLFLLLSLLYDSKTIGHIREHIESTDNNAKIYALEISDMMISDDIKELFFPIFEDLPLHERLSRFAIRFPQEKLGTEERLAEIINKDYSSINRWTKACALDMLARLAGGASGTAAGLLAANLVNPDPLLGELAAWALYSKYRGYYDETIARFEKSSNRLIPVIVRKMALLESRTDILIFDKILILRDTELFALVNETVLLNLFAGFRAAEPDPDTLTITSDSGFTLRVPSENLFEMMTGNPMMTERYLRLYVLNNHA
jgi:hypothetical protein